MACMGLKYISVLVDYTHFPPRCLVRCDEKELRAYQQETSNLVEEVFEMADARLAHLSELTGTHCESFQRPSIQPIPDDLQEGIEVWFEEGIEPSPSRIHLNHNGEDAQTDSDSNTPPVRLVVRLPSVNSEEVRKERFIVDDFWEFVHIKFDDDSEIDLMDLEEFYQDPKNDKYTVAPERYSPEVQKLTRMALRAESQKAMAAREEACVVEIQQKILFRMIQ